MCRTRFPRNWAGHYERVRLRLCCGCGVAWYGAWGLFAQQISLGDEFEDDVVPI